jgi:hypothetical protein
VETLYFDPDGTTLKISWEANSKSHTTTLNYKIQDNTLAIYGTNSEGAVNLTLSGPADLGDRIEFSQSSQPDDYIFYKTYSAARAFLDNGAKSIDLASILPGRTMYLYCNNSNGTGIGTISFLPGNVIAEKEFGDEEERGTFEIEGNIVYTKFDNEPRRAHVAVYYDGKKIIFREEEGDTTTFYFTEADARNSEPVDCDDEDSTEVSSFGFVGDFMNDGYCKAGESDIVLGGAKGIIHGWHDEDYPLQMLIVLNADGTKILCMQYDFHYYDDAGHMGSGQNGTDEGLPENSSISGNHLVLTGSYDIEFDGTLEDGHYAGTWRQQASQINSEYNGSGTFEITLAEVKK